MDPSNGQHHQEMASNSVENMLVCTKSNQDRKPKPQPEQALKCPRCDSSNTKFCYYNNYSLSQPRYFCKSCRRYWTKGGTLRNVPVGGGCRKNKRSSSSKRNPQDPHHQFNSNSNPLTNTLPYDSNDLTLAFARLQKQSNGQLGFDDHHILGNPNNTHCEMLVNHPTTTTTTPYLDALRSGFIDNTQNSSNNFQNFYFGYGNVGEVENSCGEMMVGLGYDQEMSNNGGTQAVTVTTTKQELCSGSDREDDQSSKVLWGFPWQQLNGNGISDLDSGKESWINGFGSNWHGVLNTPLM